VRLHVGVVRAEDGFCALARQLLGAVHILAAAVVSRTRVTLRVLVGHDGPGDTEHGLADEVLGGDQLDMTPLPVDLAKQHLVHLRVSSSESVERHYFFILSFR